MKGSDLLAALRQSFDVANNNQLAKRLNYSAPRLSTLGRQKSVSPRVIANLMAGASQVAMKSIRPVVEFFPLDQVASRHGRSVEIFSVKDEQGVVNRYHEGLREELKAASGIYVFFDSRGCALYVGKARAQKLWPEMRAAFNRDRTGLQSVYRTRHPSKKNVEYRSGEEKSRQIKAANVALHELAGYFSAYEVPEPMIDDLEAMLVRSFANDLLNKKMERFTKQRKRKARKGPTKATGTNKRTKRTA